MKRSPLRRRVPVGAAARRRRQAGGPQAVGRPSLSVEGYRALVRLVAARARWRCERCGTRQGCHLEHAVARSQGGADSWENVWYTCRACHRMKEAAFASEPGRLVIDRVGDGLFAGLVWHHQGAVKILVDARQWGRPPTAREAELLAALT